MVEVIAVMVALVFFQYGYGGEQAASVGLF